MKTQFDWQGDEGETNNKSAWADFAPLSPYLGTLLWPSAWGVTCFCFCVATYYKSVYIPFEDLHYSVQSVGVLALIETGKILWWARRSAIAIAIEGLWRGVFLGGIDGRRRRGDSGVMADC